MMYKTVSAWLTADTEVKVTETTDGVVRWISFNDETGKGGLDLHLPKDPSQARAALNRLLVALTEAQMRLDERLGTVAVDR